MSKIALLVPREEMLYLAHNILQEKKYNLADMRVIQTEQAVTEARNAMAAGATIIIARGLQASLIKQYTDVPVVEIAATAQEMALLVMRAKQIIKKERPFIAAVGFKNMFCDMTYFEDIYGIKLRTYFAEGSQQLKEKALEAVEDGADLMIGGDVAVSVAKEADIASLFLSITEDSLRTAFSMAESMAFAMEAEKKSHAQLEALLDYSFNGVVNLDKEGRITAANPMMREILGEDEGRLKGKKLEAVFSSYNPEQLIQVLEGRTESYASFMEANQTPVFAILAPIRVGDEVEGAILTCHKVKRQRESRLEESSRQQKKKPAGLLARGYFGQLSQASKAMQACLHQARLYARSQEPVLILGETGTKKRLWAESIHNEANLEAAPFFTFSCSGLTEEQQRESLFGDKGALYLADGGSLYLSDIEALSLSCQYSLFELICRHRDSHNQLQAKRFHIRIFASTSCSIDELGRLVSQGKFRRDLFYALGALALFVPPLRSCPEDLKELTERTVKEACEQYSRYHVLTEGAVKTLREYPWPGNQLQLENFLKRLILTAERRSIDEVMIRRLLRELYPDTLFSGPEGDEGKVSFGQECREAFTENEKEAIYRALKQNGGNRERTAAALGISKATLWRRMKKYELELQREQEIKDFM